MPFSVASVPVVGAGELFALDLPIRRTRVVGIIAAAAAAVVSLVGIVRAGVKVRRHDEGVSRSITRAQKKVET